MKKVFSQKLDETIINDVKTIAKEVGIRHTTLSGIFIESGVKKFKKTGKI